MFLSGIFTTDNNFEAFGWYHFVPLAFFFALGVFSIYMANRFLNENQKTLLGTLLAMGPLLAVVSRMLFTYYDGSFSYKSELPLHVCRVLALFAPIVMWKRWRYWTGILYFTILAGTLQANITPDIDYGYPHYGYFTYWALHSMLVILPFYCLFVYKHTIEWKDLIRTFVITNIYMVCITSFNLLTGSNYMYTRVKPPVASLLDYMGPWPWYILTVECLAVFLFLILYAPFKFKRRTH